MTAQQDVQTERMTLDSVMAMVEHAPEQAAFLREQRRELRLGMLSDDRRQWLNEHTPGWDSIELDLALGL